MSLFHQILNFFCNLKLFDLLFRKRNLKNKRFWTFRRNLSVSNPLVWRRAPQFAQRAKRINQKTEFYEILKFSCKGGVFRKIFFAIRSWKRCIFQRFHQTIALCFGSKSGKKISLPREKKTSFFFSLSFGCWEKLLIFHAKQS